MGKYQGLSHPILILIRGLPGSGKSYFAIELEKAIGKDAVVMLDPDATDYDSKEYREHSAALTAEGIDPKIHPYRFLRGKAFEGITNRKIIIWNQPFTNLGMFGRMIDVLKAYATDHGTELSVLIVEVDIDPKIAKERVERRKQQGGHGPSDTLFERYVMDYVSAASEGRKVMTIHGEDDTAQSVASVMKAIEELL